MIKDAVYLKDNRLSFRRKLPKLQKIKVFYNKENTKKKFRRQNALCENWKHIAVSVFFHFETNIIAFESDSKLENPIHNVNILCDVCIPSDHGMKL